MYGQIHLVMKQMIETEYGKDTWAKVLKASQLQEDKHFFIFKAYPDSDTFALIGAVSSTLGLPVETALKVFGGYFLTYCCKHGYDQMLSLLGVNFVTFIQNLDSLHSMLSVPYRDLVAPSFRCYERSDGTLVLHYYSTRKGLYPLVEGILEAAGKELFSKAAKVTLLNQTEEKIGKHKKVNHAVMKVEVQDLPGADKREMTWALADNEYFRHREDLLTAPLSLCDTYQSLTRGSNTSVTRSGTETVIRKEDFSIAFPYHMVLDSSLCVRQCGHDIAKLSVVHIKEGTPFKEVGVIVHPTIIHTMDNIRQFINNVFLLAIHRKVGERSVILKGQMIWMSNCRHLLFVGSPRLTNLTDFKETNMFLSDLPLYDATRDLVLVNEQRIAEIEIAKRLDETRAELCKMSKALEEKKQRTEDLLHEMLPETIIQQLKSGQSVHGEKYKHCTLLFSDVVNFTDIASKCSADDVILMLNEMYHRFDVHTDCYGVFKVETIGDAYMAVTGVPEVQKDHALRMADFAMETIGQAEKVVSPATKQPLKIRVGMHTGPVVAGVVGKKKPRYDVYGETVNIASRMESTSAPGRVHVSKSTFRELYPYGYEFLVRGPIQVDGKGKRDTYFLVGSLTFKLPQPSDKYEQLPCVVTSQPIHHTHTYKTRQRIVSTDMKKLKIVDYVPESPSLKQKLARSLNLATGQGSLWPTTSFTRVFFSGRRASGVSSTSKTSRSTVSSRKTAEPTEDVKQISTKSTTYTEDSEESGVTSDTNPYFGLHTYDQIPPSSHSCHECTLL